MFNKQIGTVSNILLTYIITQNKRFLALITFIFLANILLLPQISAHSYAQSQVDLTVKLLFNDTGDFEALQQTWLFDAPYTAYATEGLETHGDGQADPHLLKTFLEEMLESLHDSNYFTEVHHYDADYFSEIWLKEKNRKKKRKTALDLGGATGLSFAFIDKRLQMQFTVPLVTALNIREGIIKYAIYDPDFHFKIAHMPPPAPITFRNSPSLCHYNMHKPRLKPEDFDPNKTTEKPVQIYFAEWVTIVCD